MKIMRERIWSLLLCIVMVITMLPTTVSAAGGDPISTAAIRLDAANNFGITGGGTNWVYFSNYPISDAPTPVRWRVLSTDLNGDSFQDHARNPYTGKGLFLMSEYVLRDGEVKFAYPGEDNTYSTSNLRDKSSTALIYFSTAEVYAALRTTKTSDTDVSLAGTPTWKASDLSGVMSGTVMFSLSAAEANNGSYGFAPLPDTPDFKRIAYKFENPSMPSGEWWLRSSDYSDSYQAGVVESSGALSTNAVDQPLGIRPAFNLNLSTVLFTSAAENGKSSGTCGAGALTAVSTAAPTDWKLTLLDSSRKFTTPPIPILIGKDGVTVSIPYTDATVGPNEYISAILVDSSGNALYYGRLKNTVNSGDANGTLPIDIPSGLAEGSYTLKLFTEQYNGDRNTDYASAFRDLALTVLGSITVQNDGNGTANADYSIATPGTEITLTTTPNDGYQFKEWQVISGSVTIINDKFNMPAESVTVKAIFTPLTTVDSVTIKTAPSKTTYTEGEALDLTGLVVTLNKSNSTTEDVALADFTANGITVSPANGATLAASYNKVTISHTPSGKSADQPITVNPAPVTVNAVTIKTAPSKTTYTEGESLDLTGLVVTLNKSNSTTEDVALGDFAAKGITVSPANGATLATSHNKVTISHTASGKTVDQPIAVNPAPVAVNSVTIKTAPTKTTYTAGETLDLNGLVVTLHMSGDTEQDVDFSDFANNGIITNPANGMPLVPGFTAVTITAGSQSVSQSITVSSAQYVAMGDSIASGYGLADKDDSYTSLVRETLGLYSFIIANDGMNSTTLLQGLSLAGLDTYLSDATVITLSIGSNDVLAPFLKSIADQLNCDTDEIQSTLALLTPAEQLSFFSALNTDGVLKNNEQLRSAALAFAANFQVIIGRLKILAPNATIYVTNAYNPYEGISIPYGANTLNLGEIADVYIQTINKAFSENSTDYALIDVYSAFSASQASGTSPVNANLAHFNFDPHPNAAGHALIANLILTPSWPSGSNLIASGITSTGATLSWTAANGAAAVTGYRIYQNGILIGAVGGNVTTYTVTGLSASTSYSFRVQAGNAGSLWTANGPSVTATTSAASSYDGGYSSATYYTVTATAGAGGHISPSGSVAVKEGSDITFTITANDGYEIEDVLADGGSAGAVSSYTFKNVKKAHTITVSFTKSTEKTANPFTDVETDAWFYESVLYVYEKGLMTGTGTGCFDPGGSMTRSMLVTVLYRLSGDAGSYDNSFADVDPGAWYKNAVAWASATGITSGTGGGRFSPDKRITREQLAVLLYNCAGYMGYDVSAGENVNILSYRDASGISDYAYAALQWACGAGILEGDTDGNLNPGGSATRAEVAAVIERFVELVMK
ncbi:exported hypothetical protein [uncultured Eubacteriales bacterium]|uniref:Uncharacterized protein n=1 Tax=uncultured Eubacteriales bacterium TaxID=172733 RepID=A0A212KHU9_9FIRM|nr:exported hypothetical protein [uncultured Eubacteriales bacterium]